MNKIIFKELKLDINLKTCSISDNEVSLTKNEYNLLEFFLKNRNKIHSRREILNSVWGSKLSLRTVDTTISRLRKKLGSLGKYLITRLGFGYGMVD